MILKLAQLHLGMPGSQQHEPRTGAPQQNVVVSLFINNTCVWQIHM